MTLAERADTQPATGVLLRCYLALTWVLGQFAPWYLQQRLALGKEDPARWREKLGRSRYKRPNDAVIWLHAVGLGEVLALRGLISALSDARLDCVFLVTSTARSSAQGLAANLPPRTMHQFLPLDAPRYVARFLDHWRPDLAVWSEQDLWPGAVVAAHQRGIPLALVNARMNAGAFGRRARLRGLFRDTYQRFSLLDAQDPLTAQHLEGLGAPGPVSVSGSIKSAAGPLDDQPKTRAALMQQLQGRRIWCAASTHAGDEAVVLAAQAALFAQDPHNLLVLVPRQIDRGAAVGEACQAAGLGFAQRSGGGLPAASDAVYIADTFGELGIWYRMSRAALIGGGFGKIGGHNPWEGVWLNCPILHGPDVANFGADYASLHEAGAVREVTDADGIMAALADPTLAAQAPKALALAQESGAKIDELAARLLQLLRVRQDG